MGADEDVVKELSVLIVEDEVPARERMEDLLSTQQGYRLCGAAGDGISAMHAIEELRPDLVLMDIDLPEMGAFEVLENLQVEPPHVIFVTAYDEYALKAFAIHAVDYLLKPVEPERFAEALERARSVITTGGRGESIAPPRPPAGRIIVRSGVRVLFLRPQEIDAVDAAGNYVKIYRGREAFLLRTTLAAMESRLPARKFVRIQRSKLINVDRIRELLHEGKDNYLVVLADGRRLRLSPMYRKHLEMVLGEF